MPTVLRLSNEKGNPSILGWGKHKDKDVKWVLENDPAYLRFLYFNIRNARMKEDVCKVLGLNAGIAFHKRKEYYGANYKSFRDVLQEKKETSQSSPSSSKKKARLPELSRESSDVSQQG